MKKHFSLRLVPVAILSVICLVLGIVLAAEIKKKEYIIYCPDCETIDLDYTFRNFTFLPDGTVIKKTVKHIFGEDVYPKEKLSFDAKEFTGKYRYLYTRVKKAADCVRKTGDPSIDSVVAFYSYYVIESDSEELNGKSFCLFTVTDPKAVPTVFLGADDNGVKIKTKEDGAK